VLVRIAVRGYNRRKITKNRRHHGNSLKAADAVADETARLMGKVQAGATVIPLKVLTDSRRTIAHSPVSGRI